MAACDGRPTLPNASCACEAAAPQRCSTEGVERCVDGRWALATPCPEGSLCVAFARYGSGPPEPPEGGCISPHAGCPDRVEWDGTTRLVERFEAVPTTSCILSGSWAKLVPYREYEPEVRQRRVDIVTFGCDDSAISTEEQNTVFGVYVTASVSTTEGYSPKAGLLPANKAAQWYRQTLRVEKVALLKRGTEVVGLAILTDWLFKPLFAVGDTCPPPYPGEPLLPEKSCLLGDDACASCR
ncbi:MAG: hypothetical protein JRH20_15165 [Deltaproteobacteria bacterium]|nr:hypothetical protein [Deltaproteobacteria bacterium]